MSSASAVPLLLIVEDSLTQRLRLQWLLEKNGYAVHSSKDGAEALAFLAKTRPALVISDVRMPGIDGFELCRQIRLGPHGASLPVMLMTALSSAQDLLQAIRCGADNLIVKPYQEKLLLRRIASELRSRELLPEHDGETGALPVHFDGEDHVVSASREQLLSLLLSTYESAVQTGRELLHAQEDLKGAQIRLRETERMLQARLKAEQNAVESFAGSADEAITGAAAMPLPPV